MIRAKNTTPSPHPPKKKSNFFRGGFRSRALPQKLCFRRQKKNPPQKKTNKKTPPGVKGGGVGHPTRARFWAFFHKKKKPNKKTFLEKQITFSHFLHWDSPGKI